MALIDVRVRTARRLGHDFGRTPMGHHQVLARAEHEARRARERARLIDRTCDLLTDALRRVR